MIRYGIIGWLSRDSAFDEIVSRLGPPDKETTGDQPKILKWGDLEVSLDNGTIYLIALSRKNMEFVIPAELIEGLDKAFSALAGLTPELLKILCLQRGRSSRHDPELTFEDAGQQTLFVDESPCKLVFIQDSLYGIYLSL
jgi:hypothetical protein